MTCNPDIHALKWCQDEGVAAMLPGNTQALLAAAWRVHHDNYAPQGLLVETPTSDEDVVIAIAALNSHLCHSAQTELDQLNL